MSDDEKTVDGNNPKLIEDGKNTRFGQPGGADPVAATKSGNKPWSIRNSVRRLAAAEFDIDKKMTPEEFAKKFGAGGRTLTGAQMIAAKKFHMALSGNAKVMKEITEDVDGKLVQEQKIATVTLADLVNGEAPSDDPGDQTRTD